MAQRLASLKERTWAAPGEIIRRRSLLAPISERWTLALRHLFLRDSLSLRFVIIMLVLVGDGR